MSKKNRRVMVPLHTPGIVRYFTYYLIFPHDKEVWVDQLPFVHDLVWELRQTFLKDKPELCRELLTKGEIMMKTPDGVTHRLVIEETKRNRVWGTKVPDHHRLY